MPEFPDIVVYIEALERRILDQTLKRISIASPFYSALQCRQSTAWKGVRLSDCAGWVSESASVLKMNIGSSFI